MEKALYARLAGPVAESGLFLESVLYTPGRYARLLVVVDLPDGPGGVSSDQLTDASRVISDALDTKPDVIPGSYTLEVTTPGVSRPMMDERQWGRAVGRLVKVTTGAETFTERLVKVRDGVAIFASRVIALGDVATAVQEIEMGKGK